MDTNAAITNRAWSRVRRRLRTKPWGFQAMLMRALRRTHRNLIVHGLMPIFNRLGTRFYLSHRPDFSNRMEHQEFQQLTRLWEHSQRGNNRGDWPRLYCLVACIDDLCERAVPGALAELGVYKGVTAKLLSSLMPERRIYLFDTFAGFDPRDTASDPSSTEPGHYRGSLDEVQAFVGTNERICYCPGVFPDSVALVPDNERYALVHIDCDLYEPTKAACAYFYCRLSPGALMIFHDYHSGCWPGVKQAVDEFFADKPEHPVRIPDKSGTGIVAKNGTLA